MGLQDPRMDIPRADPPFWYEESGEPTGIVDKTETTLAFDNATRTLTIALTGTEFSYYIAGNLHRVFVQKTKVISNVTGLHWLYLDENEVLKETTAFTEDLLHSYATVAIVLWNAVASSSVPPDDCFDERHGITMDWATHREMHATLGTRYAPPGLVASGFVYGDGSLATHAQFGYSAGVCYDEDNKISIDADAAPAQIPIWYQVGAAGVWYQKAADDYPLIYDGAPATYTPAGGRPAYNLDTAGTWSLAEVPANRYFLVHYFATNAQTAKVVGILGQATYTGISAARAGMNAELRAIIVANTPAAEMKPLYSMLWQAGAFANVPKARLVQASTAEPYADWRYDKTSPAVAPPAVVVTPLLGYDGTPIIARRTYTPDQLWTDGADDALAGSSASVAPDGVYPRALGGIYDAATDEGMVLRDLEPPYNATEFRVIVDAKALVAGADGTKTVIWHWRGCAIAVGAWSAWAAAQVLMTVIHGTSILVIRQASDWIPLATGGMAAATPSMGELIRSATTDSLPEEAAPQRVTVEFR